MEVRIQMVKGERYLKWPFGLQNFGNILAVTSSHQLKPCPKCVWYLKHHLKFCCSYISFWLLVSFLSEVSDLKLDDISDIFASDILIASFSDKALLPDLGLIILYNMIQQQYPLKFLFTCKWFDRLMLVSWTNDLNKLTTETGNTY